MTGAVSLIATFTAREGQEDRVAGMIKDLRDSIRGQAGNTFFEVHRLRDDPRGFVVYESYESRESFEHHLAGEANTRFNAALALLIEEPESRLTWLDAP